MKDKKDFYINVDMLDRDDKPVTIKYHPVLYALIQGGKALLKDKRHFFGIVTGNVGDGKSNLVSMLVALWEQEHGRRMTYDNVVWTTEKFIEKTDRDDNVGHAIWWDEAIQGVSGKKMALTTEGELLKISLVTKRFKRHFYILIVDEIEEYSWKLIKMANFWIHVHTKHNNRGYFKCWVDKTKIKTIYQAFKYYKWDWSKINISPDLIGRFKDYLDTFFYEEEYDKKKLEGTQVGKDGKKINPVQLRNERIIKLKEFGVSSVVIAEVEGLAKRTVNEIVQKGRMA